MSQNNRIEKVAIVGASGNVGTYITAALLGTGKHKITAVTRADSKSTFPDGVAIAKVDYKDQDSLVSALKGHDMLIITMSVTAPPETQTQLIDAAHAAGVPWVLPNEFSSDPDQVQMQQDNILGAGNARTRAYIDGKPGLDWLGIACNFWYEHSLGAFKEAYGFEVLKKEVTFYDDGNTKINTSTWPQVGRAVAALLSLPVKPEGADDKSLTLDQFRNKFAYISSFYVSQKDMFASLLRVTGTTEADWKIDSEDVEQRFKDGHKQLASGDYMGFAKQLYARMFFRDGSGTYNNKLQNDLLALPQEDLDEFTKKAIELAETGYGRYGA